MHIEQAQRDTYSLHLFSQTVVRSLMSCSSMESPGCKDYTSNSSNGSSAFDNVPIAPVIPVLETMAAYREDASPSKLNLSVAVYRIEEGKRHVWNAVKKAERLLLDDAVTTKEYLPITGLEQFNKLSARLVFGDDSPVFKENRVTTVQCLSGSGSLRVGGDFLAKHYHHHTIYLPKPTYENHPNYFLAAGLQVKTYRYYDPATKGLDFQGLMDDLGTAAFGAIILLHACCHNPTGVDPNLQQWNQIRQLMRLRRQLPFFDCAFQGFVSGNLDTDAQPIRMFVADGGECLVAQSYSKILGLHHERVGALSIVCKSADIASKVESQLKLLIRPMYSSPPIHGAAIVAAILNDREMFDEWATEMKTIVDRLRGLRQQLCEALNDRGTPGNWSHIKTQVGMLTFSGLSEEQVAFLRKNYHIYIALDGRINIAGLSTKTVPYLADAIHAAVTLFTTPH